MQRQDTYDPTDDLSVDETHDFKVDIINRLDEIGETYQAITSKHEIEEIQRWLDEETELLMGFLDALPEGDPEEEELDCLLWRVQTTLDMLNAHADTLNDK